MYPYTLAEYQCPARGTTWTSRTNEYKAKDDCSKQSTFDLLPFDHFQSFKTFIFFLRLRGQSLRKCEDTYSDSTSPKTLLPSTVQSCHDVFFSVSMPSFTKILRVKSLEERTMAQSHSAFLPTWSQCYKLFSGIRQSEIRTKILKAPKSFTVA